MDSANTSESSIEQACRKYAAKRGCFLLKIQRNKGWPDRLLLCPKSKVMFLEFKRPGEQPDPFQDYILSLLRGMGYKAEMVTCQEDFQEYLEKLLS